MLINSLVPVTVLLSNLNKLNVSQEYAVLVFDVRRAVVSPPFQVHRLQVRIKAGLILFLNASFKFADEGLEETQYDSLTNLPRLFANHLHGCSKVTIMKFCS